MSLLILLSFLLVFMFICHSDWSVLIGFIFIDAFILEWYHSSEFNY